MAVVVVGKSVHRCRCITGEQSKVGIWNTVFEVLGVKEMVPSSEVGGSNPSITLNFIQTLFNLHNLNVIKNDSIKR